MSGFRLGEPRRANLALVLLPISCLLATLALGLLVGFKASNPGLLMRALPMQVLQPLHAFMGVAFVLSGLSSGVVLTLRACDSTGSVLGARWVTPLLLFFVAGSVGAITLGRGSGVEYVSWPLAMTLLIGAVLAALGAAVLRRMHKLADWSAEGAWLLVLGLLLLVLGLAEQSLGLAVSPDLPRALTVQWHALDTVFAGWNAALYGLGMLAACRPGESGKPLRGRWMFLVAAFCLLSTFGHHHYMSPQPTVLKYIALAASLLAGVSFVRHVSVLMRSWDAEPGGPPERPFFRAAEVWTLAAIGSGVLLAVPQINMLLHGTHAIVAHSMGSMIGVNVMLIFGVIVRFSGDAAPERSARIARRVRWVGVALVLLCLNLLAAGVAKGVLRLGSTFQSYDPVVRLWLMPLPVFGLGLATALGLLCHEVLIGMGAVASRATHRNRFGVEGMTCEACATTLEAELAALDGVTWARVDYATRSAEVRSDVAGVGSMVQAAAEEHGYRVQRR